MTKVSPTIPTCDGRWFAEGVAYAFATHRGEIVVIHRAANSEARSSPTPQHAI
jgi:hypothetical protein